MAGPLEGIRVLDFTWALAGSYATMILGDLGADIIKVEIPTGDRARKNGPKVDGVSTYFFSMNRGKKSVVIDLKTNKGKEIALKLVKLVDIVAENFTPGTMERLGLGYEILKQHNPKVIYAALSGFGQTGPDSEKPAADIIVQARGGLMSITGSEGGEPVRAGASIGDIGGGIFLAIGMLAALEEQRKSGQGQMLDLSMLDCQIALLENAFIRHFATGEVPVRKGTRHQTSAIHQAFPTKDGHIAFTVGNIDQWTVFLEIIDRLYILSEDKYHDRYSRGQHIKELEPIVIEALKVGTTAEWIEKFEAVGIPCAPINNIVQAAKDPQLLHRNMFVDLPCPPGSARGSFKVSNTPFKFSRTPPQLTRGAPDLGQHTDEVLSLLLGMSQKELASLKDQGIITPRDEMV
ncbi:CaiB/BaiF CoA transferase family protein [Chloroflexota bacterium]